MRKICTVQNFLLYGMAHRQPTTIERFHSTVVRPMYNVYMYMYMNNHVHSAPQLERKKRTEKKERRITHYKIDNNLNGLEKYSLIHASGLRTIGLVYESEDSKIISSGRLLQSL